MAEENINKILEKHNEDIKRHIDVLKEDFDDKVQLISEQHSSIQTTLKSHTEMIGSMKEDIEVIKSDVTVMKVDMETVKSDMAVTKVDIEFIKNELKQKVARDEFAFLEKRVSMLEAKLSQR